LFPKSRSSSPSARPGTPGPAHLRKRRRCLHSLLQCRGGASAHRQAACQRPARGEEQVARVSHPSGWVGGEAPVPGVWRLSMGYGQDTPETRNSRLGIWLLVASPRRGRGLGPGAMTSIERTAYPRLGRVVTARELDRLSPLPDEIEWARDRASSDEHLLTLVVSLKCFQRLGYFPRCEQVPKVSSSMSATAWGWMRERSRTRRSARLNGSASWCASASARCSPPANADGRGRGDQSCGGSEEPCAGSDQRGAGAAGEGVA
jgi:Domain of unknown function (DUF4158)